MRQLTFFLGTALCVVATACSPGVEEKKLDPIASMTTSTPHISSPIVSTATPTAVSSATLPQASSSTHVLVELRVAPERNAKADWADHGLNLLDPVDERLWYASVMTKDIESIAALDGVVRIDAVRPVDKLTEVLREAEEPFFYQLRPGGRIAYSVLFHRDVTAEEVQGLSSRLDIKFEDFFPDTFAIVRAITVNVPRGGLEALSKIDIIARIEPSAPPVQDQNLTSQAVSNEDASSTCGCGDLS